MAANIHPNSDIDALRQDIMSQFKDKGSARITLEEGVTVALEPCFDGDSMPQFFDQLSYILVDGPCWATWMCGEPEKVLERLRTWKITRDMWVNEAQRVRELYQEAIERDLDTKCPEYDTYSDMHKEVFGYRPHGWYLDPLHNAG